MRDDRGKRVLRADWGEGAGFRERASAVFDPPAMWGLVLVVFVCFVILWRFDFDWIAWVVGAALIVTGFVGTYFFGTWPRFELWRCQACGHDLGAISRDSDGLTVCPECGAAWRVVAGGEGDG